MNNRLNARNYDDDDDDDDNNNINNNNNNNNNKCLDVRFAHCTHEDY